MIAETRYMSELRHASRDSEIIAGIGGPMRSEIINNKTMNLANINTMVNLQPMIDERKNIVVCWREAQLDHGS